MNANAVIAANEATIAQLQKDIAAMQAQVAMLEAMNANLAPMATEPEPTTVEATVEVTTLDRFLQYAADAGNWSGTPLVGGNVGGDASDKGYIVNMKKRGLVETFEYDRCTWIDFTDKGIALAAEHGITITAA